MGAALCGSKRVSETSQLRSELAEMRLELQQLGEQLQGKSQSTLPSVQKAAWRGQSDELQSPTQETPRSFTGPIAGPTNEILEHLWPRISAYATDVIVNEVGPAVRAAMPARLKGLDFDRTKCHLGEQPLQFRHVQISNEKKQTSDGITENLKFRCRVEWNADLSMVLKLSGAEFGIIGLQMRGQLLVELVNMMSRPPMFEGIRMVFLDPPELDLKFAGTAGRLLNFGFIRHQIVDSIQGQLSQRMVAPQHMGFKMVPSADIFSITCPPPDGILTITVWNAEDLLPMDINWFGKGSSDPYVKVRCGAHVFRSKTQWKTLCPNFECHVDISISSSQNQRVWIELYDEDLFTEDDFLGKVSFPVSVMASWVDSGRIKVDLQSEEGVSGGRGSVCLSAVWRPLVVDADCKLSNSLGVITAGVYSASHLPDLGPGATYWISAQCSGMPGVQTSEKVPLANIDEVWDQPSIESTKAKLEFLKSHGIGDSDIAWIFDADSNDPITLARADTKAALTVMGGGNGRNRIYWRRGFQFLSGDISAATLTFRVVGQARGKSSQILGTRECKLGDLKTETLIQAIAVPDTRIVLRLKLQLSKALDRGACRTSI